MKTKLKPCPFCGGYPEPYTAILITHCCPVLDAEIWARADNWNRRAEDNNA